MFKDVDDLISYNKSEIIFFTCEIIYRLTVAELLVLWVLQPSRLVVGSYGFDLSLAIKTIPLSVGWLLLNMVCADYYRRVLVLVYEPVYLRILNLVVALTALVCILFSFINPDHWLLWISIFFFAIFIKTLQLSAYLFIRNHPFYQEMFAWWPLRPVYLNRRWPLLSSIFASGALLSHYLPSLVPLFKPEQKSLLTLLFIIVAVLFTWTNLSPQRVQQLKETVNRYYQENTKPRYELQIHRPMLMLQVLATLVIIAFVFISPLGDVLVKQILPASYEQILKDAANWVSSLGLLLPLVALVIMIIQVLFPPLFPVPNTIFLIAHGLAFGLWSGALYNWLVFIIVASIAYYWARFLGRERLRRFLRRRGLALDVLDGFIQAKGARWYFLLRMFSWVVIPPAILNYLAGLLGLKHVIFVLINLVTAIPRAFVYALLGAWAFDMGVIFMIKLVITLSLLATIGVLSIAWWRTR